MIRKHHALLIDDSSENACLLGRYLPSKYELIWMKPQDNGMDINSLNHYEMIFICMEKKKNLYLTLYNKIRKNYPECKIVWIANTSGSALTAFEENADAFMLLPISKSGVTEVFKRITRAG